MITVLSQGQDHSRTHMGTDPDRAPQIHVLEPLCSFQGSDDKLNREMEERGKEGRSQGQSKGGCPLMLFLPICISAEGRRQGLKLNVRQISLSLLRLMRGRDPGGNYSSQAVPVPMFLYIVKR